MILAEVKSVNVEARTVSIGEREIAYDYLILATGSRHSYFGHDEWEKLAPGLKSLEDAIEIRRRLLLAFEYAEKITDDAAKKAAMTRRTPKGDATRTPGPVWSPARRPLSSSVTRRRRRPVRSRSGTPPRHWRGARSMA